MESLKSWLDRLWADAVAMVHKPEDPLRQRLEALAEKAKRKRLDVVRSGRERLTTF